MVRARVLKIEGEQVTLGVYYQGSWWRVPARTRIPLQLMGWIEGELVFPENDEEVYFRIDEDSLSIPDGDDPYEHDGSIDLQA